MWVRLHCDWTDPAGVEHVAGDVVEVDAVTLAELEASGVGSAPEPPGTWRPRVPELPPDSAGQVPDPTGRGAEWNGLGGYAQDDTVIVSGEVDRPAGPDPRREWS